MEKTPHAEISIYVIPQLLLLIHKPLCKPRWIYYIYPPWCKHITPGSRLNKKRYLWQIIISQPTLMLLHTLNIVLINCPCMYDSSNMPMIGVSSMAKPINITFVHPYTTQ